MVVYEHFWGQQKEHAEVIAKWDGFFQVRKNIRMQCAWFNLRVQLVDESVEQFITNLYQFANIVSMVIWDEMICDCIIVGIHNYTLSERLQLDPDLTLEKVNKLVHQREAVHEHQQFLKGRSNEGAMVETVSKNNGTKQLSRKPPRPLSQVLIGFCNKRDNNKYVCTHCGKGSHNCQVCQAKDVACHKCSKKGHYSSMCYTKSVVTISEESDLLETAYLDILEE